MDERDQKKTPTPRWRDAGANIGCWELCTIIDRGEPGKTFQRDVRAGDY
jgi:hypothetical protein